MAETAGVSFCTLSFCSPLIAISLFLFNTDRIPFASAFCWCSCHGSFVSGLKIPSPRRLIQEFLHHGFQSLVARSHILLLCVLIVQCQTGLELVTQVSVCCISFPAYRPRVPSRLTIRLRPISYECLGRRLHVKLLIRSEKSRVVS